MSYIFDEVNNGAAGGSSSHEPPHVFDIEKRIEHVVQLFNDSIVCVNKHVCNKGFNPAVEEVVGTPQSIDELGLRTIAVYKTSNCDVAILRFDRPAYTNGDGIVTPRVKDYVVALYGTDEFISSAAVFLPMVLIGNDLGQFADSL